MNNVIELLCLELDKDKTVHQHAIVCGLHQLGKLILLLNTAAKPLIADNDSVGGENPSPLINVFDKVLLSQSDAVR